MAKLTIAEFAGELPAIDDELLPDKNSTYAQNLFLKSGKFLPLKAPSGGIQMSANATNFWLLPNGEWIGFTDEVSVVDAQVFEANNRFYYTGSAAGPKKSDKTLWPGTEYNLGVKPPSAAPTVTVGGTGTGTTKYYVSYVYTMVTTWGEESAPSPATAVTVVEEDEHVDLSNIDTPAGSGYSWDKKRIYRLESGTQGAEYLFLGEIDAANTTFADDTGANDIKATTSDVLPTEGWSEPPSALQNLTQGHGGMVFGNVGKTIYICEPHVPYAWPEKYQISFDADIIGLAAYNELIIVFTRKGVWALYGNAPESLVPKKIDNYHKLTHRMGPVRTDRGVLFPSQSGLCITDGFAVTLLTKDVMTPLQWIQLLATTFDLIGSYYENTYIGFGRGSEGTAFSVDLDTYEIVRYDLSGVLYFHSDGFLDAKYDPANGELNLLIKHLNGTVNRHVWDFGPTYMSGTWTSKTFVDREQYSIMKMDSDFISSTPVSITIQFYKFPITTTDKGGIVLYQKSLYNNKPVRLPTFPGGKFKFFIVIESSSGVNSIQLATNPKELI